jgi:hypothetical protein
MFHDIDNPIKRAAETAYAGVSETIAPKLPEGAIRLPDLTIGGKTHRELERALDSGGFRVSFLARDLLRSSYFTTLSNPQTISLVRVNVSDLGLTEPLTRQIYAKAKSFGLELCPAEVGPQLRLEYKNQPLGDRFCIGMNQIHDSNGDMGIFELNRTTSGLQLVSRWARSGRLWYPESDFVFSLANKKT